MPGADECNRNLEAFSERLLAALYLLGQHRAALMESDAKMGAPWRDRTGNARQGLFGEVMADKDSLKIRIAHTMEYGVWLELCHHKRFAILEPTAKRHAPEFCAEVERLVKGT